LKQAKLKRGEVRVKEVQFSKAEFAALPESERIHYFMLAQATNELTMLRTLTIQAFNGMAGPRPVKEANLGMVLMLSRLTAGRLHEAWGLLEKESVFKQLEEMTQRLDQPSFTEALASATQSMNNLPRFFGDAGNPITRVRKKIAFHQDRAPVVAAFNALSDEYDLTDFHTGIRGTTFYGAADTLAALAMLEVVGSGSDLLRGQQEFARLCISISEDVEEVTDSYLSAFCASHFGAERFSREASILRDRPPLRSAKAHFFLDTRGVEN
jgi:hypothetical protein